jgi:1-acyl-sn-glycerol-3-phosphate acyltransferase
LLKIFSLTKIQLILLTVLEVRAEAMFIKILRAIYFWVTSVSFTLVLWLVAICCQLWVVLGFLPKNGSPIHKIAIFWGQSLMKLMPGWSVVIEGRENLPEPGVPVVMVANHESMTDIWAMYYLGVQFRWLSKDTVFRYPMIGVTMKWCGYVPVNRKSRESGAEAMRQSAVKLAMGLPMFFFPEGTRSVDGVIKPFKLGAFKLAQSAGVSVVPIVIHGAGELFAKGSLIPGTSAKVRLRVLPALPPPPKDSPIEVYSEMVRQKIIQGHADVLRNPVFETQFQGAGTTRSAALQGQHSV